MEWCGRNFKSESDQRHDDARGQERCHWTKLLRDRGETGRGSHSINEADAEKGEGARGAAEQEILQPRFRRTEVGLVERSHDVERQPRELEADENNEKLFAADEQHQSNRRQ